MVQTRFEGLQLPISHQSGPLTSSDESGGLKVTITKDPTVNILDYCLFPSFSVHSPYELPDGFDDLKFNQFDYGKSLDVLITPQVIFTDEDLIDVPPKRRSCYFDGEHELKFYKFYTKHNCEMECFADFLFRAINCTPYYLVRDESTKVCDLEQAKYFISRQNITEIRKCNCLERCNSVKYEIEIQQKWITANTDKSVDPILILLS
jgi:hypothetical protein